MQRSRSLNHVDAICDVKHEGSIEENAEPFVLFGAGWLDIPHPLNNPVLGRT